MNSLSLLLRHVPIYHLAIKQKGQRQRRPWKNKNITQTLSWHVRLELRLVFTSEGVGVGVVSGVVRARAYDQVKIKNRSRKRSHKCDGIGVRRIRTLPFLPTPLPTPSFTFHLWSSENQIVGVGSRSGRINQSKCTFPSFVIGLVLLLLLLTPTIWFSLDHKRNVSDGVISGIGTLFSLGHKLYASDYDSDSDSAKENPCFKLSQISVS